VRTQIYLGPALAGAPFHHHGPAFNVLLFGMKRWTLTPPGYLLLLLDRYGTFLTASMYVYRTRHIQQHAPVGVDLGRC
jgi:hypothetical protein